MEATALRASPQCVSIEILLEFGSYITYGDNESIEPRVITAARDWLYPPQDAYEAQPSYGHLGLFPGRCYELVQLFLILT